MVEDIKERLTNKVNQNELIDRMNTTTKVNMQAIRNALHSPSSPTPIYKFVDEETVLQYGLFILFEIPRRVVKNMTERNTMRTKEIAQERIILYLCAILHDHLAIRIIKSLQPGLQALNILP